MQLFLITLTIKICQLTLNVFQQKRFSASPSGKQSDCNRSFDSFNLIRESFSVDHVPQVIHIQSIVV